MKSPEPAGSCPAPAHAERPTLQRSPTPLLLAISATRTSAARLQGGCGRPRQRHREMESIPCSLQPTGLGPGAWGAAGKQAGRLERKGSSLECKIKQDTGKRKRIQRARQ